MDTLYRILAIPLTWFYDLSGNYVVAMILYAVLIKLVLFPFGIKQQKGMVRQAKMRPKEMAIRKRYAGRDDKKTQMKMQEDLQKLYQEEGYNPMAGCAPMLIQLPIIWVLYRIVYGPLLYIKGVGTELCKAMAAHASTLGSGTFNYKYQLQWIDVIDKNFDSFRENVEGFSAAFPSQAEFTDFFNKFKLFGLDLTQKPSSMLGTWTAQAIAIIAIPVLVFVAQYLSMKIVRKFSYQPVQDAQSAASMKIMDFTMPLLTLWMAFVMPGILGIYWIINSLLAMVQQIVLKKMYPTPVFTDEDYKLAEKQLNGKMKPVKAAKAKKKKNPKSLHHIDDDDGDEEEEQQPAPQKSTAKKSKLIEPAPMKENEKKDGGEEIQTNGDTPASEGEKQ